MISKDVLSELINKYQLELDTKNFVSRNTQVSIRPKFATIISGIRRCGKSVLAKQLLSKKKPTYYFHFENVQLARFEQEDFAKLDECFVDVLGKEGVYLLDEIQNILGWEIYVRQLVDAGNIVVVTGSNATMLSKELGTRLTGRNLRYELYPFSFVEYLKAIKKKASLLSFKGYFEDGGFPEFVLTKDSEILKNLFQDVFYRDILVRNDLRKETELKDFISFISSNIGVEVSYSKLQKMLELGSHNTVSQFIHACEQAYLFFQLERFDYSRKKQLISPKKLYCVDNGLLRLNSFSFAENSGRYLENVVYVELRRRHDELYYHKIEHECDFIVKEGLKITSAIQVCYDLNSENQKREFDGLIEVCSAHKLKEGLLLTYKQEDTFIVKGVKIIVKPVWKWLLE